MLIAAQNPCPCGYSTDPTNPCTCRPEQIIKYQKKISGPLLDRIDMIIEVPKLLTNDYFETSLSESSSLIRTRVQQARNLQTLRFSQTHHKTNSEIPSQHIEKYITLTDKTQSLIKTAATKLNLSARVITRILKVSRTIADLAQSETIEPVHLAEALQYRDHSISRR
jgi:magnesium chelatase family protein